MNPIDRVIGSNLARLRAASGLSASQMARAINVAEPRLDDFERGRERVSAATLQDLCTVLSVSVDAFFEPEKAEYQPAEAGGIANDDRSSGRV